MDLSLTKKRSLIDSQYLQRNQHTHKKIQLYFVSELFLYVCLSEYISFLGFFFYLFILLIYIVSALLSFIEKKLTVEQEQKKTGIEWMEK